MMEIRKKEIESEERGIMIEENVADKTGNTSDSYSIQPSFALPLTLKFEDLKYRIYQKKYYILDGISGSAHPGEFLALLGPSGSGKTTLVNLLSGRLKSNLNSSGAITYNGRPYANILKRRIGFVTQDDVVFSNLTVKETLTYAAFLRLPKILSRQQKQQRALDVITQLGLERSQDTVIGGECFRGAISGGERKRVCIGQELLLNPSLLCLDEPTSCLDSTTALRIVQILQNMAKGGKTVITTIHQPSSKIFSKFDKLILLGKGRSLFFGKPSEAMPYFSSIGYSPLIAMNPAEFLIDLANGNINDKSFPSHATKLEKPSSTDVHEYLIEAYEAKEGKKRVVKDEEGEGHINQRNLISNEHQLWAPTWSEQFRILVRRSFKERRHEYLSITRIIQVTATAVIVGLLWWNSHNEGQEGLLFFISVFWCFFPLFTAIFTFPQEREMLGKERAAGMYRLSAYFAARNVSDLPLDLVMPTVFVVIFYFMVGLKMSFPAFSLTMLTVFLTTIASQGLGLTIGAAFMDVKKAATFASIVLMTFMLSAEFFLQVPWFMSWMRYISINYYTYKLLVKIQEYPCISGNSCAIKELRADEEVAAMMVMIVVYRLLSFLFLRNMKFTNMS
ncbi:ABC transporter G family member 22-like isoform X2 [Euphorbia lathyris]|uniref:ABC transporter G family member 22-like isoform X2 n=1 Tax=Euphorbia lathyris TaxID=212925 RepID=UPI003313C73C